MRCYVVITYLFSSSRYQTNPLARLVYEYDRLVQAIVQLSYSCNFFDIPPGIDL